MVATSRRATRAGRTNKARTHENRAVNVSRSREPARKFIQVRRPPAKNIKFKVPMWIPISKLTPKERELYLKEESMEQEHTTPENATATASANPGEVQSQQQAVEGAQVASTQAVSSVPVPPPGAVVSSAQTGTHSETTQQIPTEPSQTNPFMNPDMTHSDPFGGF